MSLYTRRQLIQSGGYQGSAHSDSRVARSEGSGSAAHPTREIKIPSNDWDTLLRCSNVPSILAFRSLKDSIEEDTWTRAWLRAGPADEIAATFPRPANPTLYQSGSNDVYPVFVKKVYQPETEVSRWTITVTDGRDGSKACPQNGPVSLAFCSTWAPEEVPGSERELRRAYSGVLVLMGRSSWRPSESVLGRKSIAVTDVSQRISSEGD